MEKSQIHSAKKRELHPGPLEHHSNALLTELGQEISEVSFVSSTTSHFGHLSFTESIEHGL